MRETVLERRRSKREHDEGIGFISRSRLVPDASGLSLNEFRLREFQQRPVKYGVLIVISDDDHIRIR